MVVFSAAGGREVQLDLFMLYRRRLQLFGLDTAQLSLAQIAQLYGKFGPLFESRSARASADRGALSARGSTRSLRTHRRGRAGQSGAHSGRGGGSGSGVRRGNGEPVQIRARSHRRRGCEDRRRRSRRRHSGRTASALQRCHAPEAARSDGGVWAPSRPTPPALEEPVR